MMERFERWSHDCLRDARYGGRALFASPGFTATVVLSLALGIGANTAIFSILHALVLRSLPVSDPERLVVVIRNQVSTRTAVPLFPRAQRDVGRRPGLPHGPMGEVRVRARMARWYGQLLRVLGVDRWDGIVDGDDCRGHGGSRGRAC